MDGTPSKGQPSKYITPCRTLGLKRKSTPHANSVKKGNTETPTTPLVASKQFTPKQRDLTQTPILKAKNRPAKRLLNTNHEVDETIEKINQKFSTLKAMRQQEIYSKKHDVSELKKNTAVWLSVGKQVLLMLVEEVKKTGKECTPLDVLIEHDIPLELIGFNPATMDFD